MRFEARSPEKLSEYREIVEGAVAGIRTDLDCA
jgi:hypothetical protein